MRPTLGADSLSAERTILDTFDYVMRTVAVVERAHLFKVGFATAGAGILIDNVMAGVALVPALFKRDIVKRAVLFSKFPLFRCPVHGITLYAGIYNVCIQAYADSASVDS